MAPIIATEGVWYSYEDGTEALKNVSLRIHKGKKIAVLGPNGAGKSTLFLHLNGILKPKSGTVFFRGQPLRYNKKTLTLLRKEVGIVFQNPDEQLFSPVVYDDIAYGPRNLPLSKNEIETSVYRAMEEMEILHLQRKATHFLSLGQKKRVAIAGVLAMDPELIILDEPTAGLDRYYSRKLLALLDDIHSRGKTIVLSTHNMDLAYEWAEEIVVLQQGNVIAQGEVEEIFRQRHLYETANLEQPLILEIYEELVKNRFLSGRQKMPRTKEELFHCLAEAARQSQFDN